jgi:integrase
MEQHYLPWCAENKRRVRDDRGLYQNWLKPRFAKTFLGNLKPLDLEHLKKDMKKEGKSEATIKHALCVVRQAFNKAVLWRLWKGDNPCKGVSFPAPNNARQRFLTPGEAANLLRGLTAHSKQVAKIATMSLYGGLRLQEILNLTWSNVDFDNGIIFVQDTKNNSSRPIFITEPIRKVLEELTTRNPDQLLFTTRQGKPVQWLSKSFRAVVDSLKLNDGVKDPRERVCFHTLRHTYASWAVMAGVPLYTVGKALGHKSTVMTQRYAHLAPDSHRIVFEAVANHCDFKGEQ